MRLIFIYTTTCLVIRKFNSTSLVDLYYLILNEKCRSITEKKLIIIIFTLTIFI